MYFDPTYILVIIGAAVCGLASMHVKNTFNKYNDLYSSVTAQEVAATMLRDAGIDDVRIESVSGSLTDHYDPTQKVLRLSESVYGSYSVAAIGVAAHECGHAIQHKEGYMPLKLRSLSVPAANFGSVLSWPLMVLGIILGYRPLTTIGILLFSLVVLFQLITLPVEFNASSRALAILDGKGVLRGEQLQGAKAVLSAAAMTYVAALFSSMMQLTRLILISKRNDD
ncbi:MAG: zinc metallopeptidase [Clostridia bacterium]|nr:zinc metallopeptidase [Clostridia bacterium]